MATMGRRRALGQHFLIDQTIASMIARTAVDEAVRTGCTALLEIGPGKGAITVPLRKALAAAPSIQRFFMVEKDARLAAEWRAQDVPTIEADFVHLPEAEWLGTTPLTVASNLPYSVGTAILTRLALHPEKIPVMVLMFQAEVARRLRAEVDTRAWGSLSIWLQNRWDVTRLLDVPPASFRPPPEVDSEVVVLRPRAQARIQIPPTPAAEALWEQLLKHAFAHRRKMLRSGLPASGPWRNALEAAQVDGTKRAEALDWPDWQRLYEAVSRSAL